MRQRPGRLAILALAALAACAGSDDTNAQTTGTQTRDAAPVAPPAQAEPPAAERVVLRLSPAVEATLLS